MKNKNKKNQLLFAKNTLTELTPDSLQDINGGEALILTLTNWPPKKTDTVADTGIN